ncbi:Ig domain-containing protein [Deinococcus sonorensis]|uniref:Ig domain-containing protein n=2 Tax=Deinococcus sonorensis TaxID=309891 RepID=A0AAU7UA25_9DEIO
MRRRLLWPLGLTLSVVLAACGSTGTSSTTSTSDALYFATSNVPVGYVGESYSTDIQMAGGIGPYSLKLTDGQLPEGLTLSGRTITGRPSKAGLYTFTLEASDAALSSKVQKITLNVAALPPLSLNLQLPKSEVRGETRLPLTISGPRGVRAARYVWKMPAGLNVTRIVPSNNKTVIFWKVSSGTLTMDLGFKSTPANGAQLAMLTVRPSKPVTLTASGAVTTAVGADGVALGQPVTASVPSAPAGSPSTPAAGQPSVPSTTEPSTPADQTLSVPSTPVSVPTPPVSTPATPTTPDPAPADPNTEDSGSDEPGSIPLPPMEQQTPPAPSTPGGGS